MAEGSRSAAGIARTAAVLVIAAFLVIAGVGAFAITEWLLASGPSACPSPACPIGPPANDHDVSLFVPFRSVAAGESVPLTVGLPVREQAPRYTVNFGDGVNRTTTAGTITHRYATPGAYLLYATALVNGRTHDSLQNIVALSVDPESGPGPGGLALNGSILANSTNPSGSGGATAVVQPGQTVTIWGGYIHGPVDTGFVRQPLLLRLPNSSFIRSENETATALRATIVFPQPGLWNVALEGQAQNSTTVVDENFTWSVFVGFGAAERATAVSNPRPGALVDYELAPGGSASEDPAIDYETVGEEPIMNVYQTLIAYNGSWVGPAPEDFVPVLASCVPGSSHCLDLYGTSLTDGIHYTFVLQGNASFYDPSTGVSWGVWPSDVVFSVARSLGFSDLPAPFIRPGWILAQALLGGGNASWSSIHAPYNNTPSGILGSMSVNDSRFCPTSALRGPASHGCITFTANGDGHAWPSFLELLADPLGASVVPCGWFSASSQAAGIPYWTQGNISGTGDRPCGMPGDGAGVPVGQIPTKGWDEWEVLGSGTSGAFPGNVQWSMVGSGPYYLVALSVAGSYVLGASPAYRANPYCAWIGCPARPGEIPRTVTVVWETSEAPGEQAVRNGSADLATFPFGSIGLLLQLVQEGRLSAIERPLLSISAIQFTLEINGSGAAHFQPSLTVPSDFFSSLAMREFFARAYPYAAIDQLVNQHDGIASTFATGGVIPQYLADYYPIGIPWPGASSCSPGGLNLSSNPMCPEYWWTQMQQPGSAYSDGELSACTTSAPCTVTALDGGGGPSGEQFSLWSSEVRNLSGGRILLEPVTAALGLWGGGSARSTSPVALLTLGWGPDFPDPIDYVGPFYLPNSTWTQMSGLPKGLGPSASNPSCPHGPTEVAYWIAASSNLSLSQACQGIAYQAMVGLLNQAATETNHGVRVAMYAEAEQIANALCLYVYSGQDNSVDAIASTWNVGSLDTNPVYNGDQVFSEITPSSPG